MDAKLLLVVIATVLTVAAAAPQYGYNYWQQQYYKPVPTQKPTTPPTQSYTCRKPNTLKKGALVYGVWRNLNLCSKPGTYLGYCIKITPELPYCKWPQISDCTKPSYPQWGQEYYVGICNEAYGHCVANGNVEVCNGGPAITYNRLDIQKALEDELDQCFCIEDEKGHKICTPENCDEGVRAEKSDVSDCFCVEDEKGHKICTPENCDKSERIAQSEEEGDCFCVTHEDGQKVCSPENCDTAGGKQKALAASPSEDCFCIKDAQGNKVCDPEGCDGDQQ